MSQEPKFKIKDFEVFWCSLYPYGRPKRMYMSILDKAKKVITKGMDNSCGLVLGNMPYLKKQIKDGIISISGVKTCLCIFYAEKDEEGVFLNLNHSIDDIRNFFESIEIIEKGVDSPTRINAFNNFCQGIKKPRKETASIEISLKNDENEKWKFEVKRSETSLYIEKDNPSRDIKSEKKVFKREVNSKFASLILNEVSLDEIDNDDYQEEIETMKHIETMIKLRIESIKNKVNKLKD